VPSAKRRARVVEGSLLPAVELALGILRRVLSFTSRSSSFAQDDGAGEIRSQEAALDATNARKASGQQVKDGPQLIEALQMDRPTLIVSSAGSWTFNM
jgi:hypothetical protein